MSAKAKPSRIAWQAANEILHWAEDEAFLRLPRKQRRVMEKERLRIASIVHAVRTTDLDSIKSLYQ